LIELLITIVIIAIMASMGMAYYGRGVRRSHWDTARDVLLMIYSGEQVFQTTANTYVDADACAPAWRCIYMDDPNTPTIPVTYGVGGVTATTFTATATYTPTGDTQTIDENRAAGGTWVRP
jgi:Tfp pilus assembly protein PilE